MELSLYAVTIVVPDYDQAIAFYVDTLGFTLVADERISETKRWVLVAPDPAGPALLLARADGADQSAAIGNQTGGRVGYRLTRSGGALHFERVIVAGESETPLSGTLVALAGRWLSTSGPDSALANQSERLDQSLEEIAQLRVEQDRLLL